MNSIAMGPSDYAVHTVSDSISDSISGSEGLHGVKPPRWSAPLLLTGHGF